MANKEFNQKLQCFEKKSETLIGDMVRNMYTKLQLQTQAKTFN
jgi:hypothetical protein